MTWRDRAACRGLNPDVFFPGRRDDPRPAKQVCATCPVRGECLEHAIVAGEKQGIWGGVGERERRRARQERGIVFQPGTGLRVYEAAR